MRLLTMLLVCIAIQLCGWSQSIFSNSITGTNPNTADPYTDGQVVDPNLTVSGIGRGSGINGSNANNRYNASGWTIDVSPGDDDYFEFTLTPKTGYQINFTGFVFTGQASASGPIYLSIKSSLDGYASEIASLNVTGSSVDLSAALYQNVQTPVSFRIYGWGGTSTAGTFSINEFDFTGSLMLVQNNTGPKIEVNPSLTSFNSIHDQPSNYQTYSVNCSRLTSDLTITSSQGYEISLSSNNGFSRQIVLSPTNGSISNIPIYVRQHSTIYGLNNGNITHAATGAITRQIEVSGIVLATEPGILSTLSFQDVTSTSFSIHFNGGDGNGRIVMIKAGGMVTGNPVDGINYTASSVFGMGAMIATGEYVVYSGSDNMVQVTGLIHATNYFVSVFEYNNGGAQEAVNYSSNAQTGAQLTSGGLSGFQLSQMNIPFTIDFDQTAYETNNGKFDGTGFSPSPSAGQLSSGAWAVMGWSDGDLDFNGTGTSGDYARGFTGSHPTTGGIYAFEPVTGNRSLGFQPGSGDWSPGSLTLRIQNQTGTNLTHLGIAYKLYVFNNADRSSSFNISYSTDNTSFTEIPVLNYMSPVISDVSPLWMLNERSAEIQGLSVPPGQYVYLRWSSADVAGTGSRDEFALDDIALTGNPTANASLPVRFTSLEAVQKGNEVQLSFSNETEENVEQYIIERSGNGNHFIPLAILKPSKNDGGRSFYSYIDLAPLKGNNFYRIKSVENNDLFTYSTIIRIRIDDAIQKITVYPNPVTGGTMAIGVDHIPRGTYFIKIHDAAGRLIMESQFKHEGGAITRYVTVSSLQPGWYSVQITGEVILRSQFMKIR